MLNRIGQLVRRAAAFRPLLFLLAAEALALLLAFALHPRAFALAAVFPMLLLLGVLIPWLQLRGVHAEIEYPLRRGQVGQPFPVRVHLVNRWPFPVAGLVVRGGWSLPGAAHDDLTLLVPWLSPWKKTSLEFTVTPTRRGSFPARAPRLACGFPFRIWEATRALPSTQPALIWPPVIQLGRKAAGIQRSGFVGEMVQSSQAGTMGEVTGVRPYRDGESLRRIHWPQTARRDRLMVCERSRSAGQGLIILLETDPHVYRLDSPSRRSQLSGTDARSKPTAPHEPWQVLDSRERAIAIVASVASWYARQNWLVTVVADRGQIHRCGSPSACPLLLDELARIPEDRGATLQELLDELDDRSLQQAAVLVVTSAAGLERWEEPRRATLGCRYVVVDSAGSEPKRTSTRWDSAEPCLVGPHALNEQGLGKIAEVLSHAG